MLDRLLAGLDMDSPWNENVYRKYRIQPSMRLRGAGSGRCAAVVTASAISDIDDIFAVQYGWGARAAAGSAPWGSRSHHATSPSSSGEALHRGELGERGGRHGGERGRDGGAGGGIRP
eukprot:COSAG02_NODE_3605_length_6491_cov_3869.716990_1_plen_117_part_10